MRRSVLISFLSLLLVCICVSSGLADARKLNLIFIGGDSDTEEGKNNLFRNMMISHEAFQEGAEAFFIKSAGRDYSNAAAIERTKAAEALLEDGSLTVWNFSAEGDEPNIEGTGLVYGVWPFGEYIAMNRAVGIWIYEAKATLDGQELVAYTLTDQQPAL